MKLVNWNVEWANPQSLKTPEILNRIKQHTPEIICLTETHPDLLNDIGGHTISAQADYGYKTSKGRKVLLWSTKPWQEIDDLGSNKLPPGRFISGVTQTSFGQVAIIGICIPWFGSRTGVNSLKKCERFEDHAEFLAELKLILEEKIKMYKKLIVVGDFNQRISGKYVPKYLHSALIEALSPSLTIISGELVCRDRESIDHIAITSNLATNSVKAIDNLHNEKKLSDHFGVAANLTLNKKL